MSDREAIIKNLKLLLNYKKEIIFIFLLMMISTFANLFLPLIGKDIMDKGFLNGNIRLLIKLVLVSTIIHIFISLINVLNERIRIEISSKMEFSLSEKAVLHLMHIQPEYFKRTNHSEIMNIIYTDIGNIVSIAERGVFYVVSQIFSIVGGIIGLLLIDYRLTFIVLLFIPFKFFIMMYFAKKRKSIMNEYILNAQDYAKWFGDTIGGIQEIKLFNIIPFKSKEFRIKQNSVINKRKKLDLIEEWNSLAEVMFMQLLMMIIYIIGGSMIFSLKISIGSIFAFITYSSYVTSPISAMLNIGYMFSGMIPSTKRFYEFMEEIEENRNENIYKRPHFGDLEIKKVRFSYNDNQPIFNNLNISFPSGSKTAIMGKNGSGKTTILSLITRMYQVDSGSILLNGVDINNLMLDEYRGIFSVVSQQVYLFDDSIKRNICLYKEITDKELYNAIEYSGLKDFIDEVTVDYIVGRDGTLLSGGQKQKIALARALIHNKPIVIFDEATSNADTYSELRLNKLLQSNLKEKTVIIISHKSDVLSFVDNIIFLDDEKVIQGSYDDLYSKNKNFRQMLEAY